MNEMIKLTGELATCVCQNLCTNKKIYCKEAMENICAECQMPVIASRMINTYNHINDFEKSQISILLKELAKERKKHEWITERLPENSEELVLVQVNGNPATNITLEDAMELAIYDKTEGWILQGYPKWKRPEVTAWRPLPELYKKE